MKVPHRNSLNVLFFSLVKYLLQNVTVKRRRVRLNIAKLIFEVFQQLKLESRPPP